DHDLCPSDVPDWTAIHSRLRLGSGLVSLRRPSASVLDYPRQSSEHSHPDPRPYTVLLPTLGHVDDDLLRRLCALDESHDDGGTNRRIHSNCEIHGVVSKCDTILACFLLRFTLS